MPKWIHDRARHIQAKNPGMAESTSFAIATQQAHKLEKTPKGYGTVEGRKSARKKFSGPKKSYTQTADPKGIGKKLDAKMKKRAEQLIDPNNPLLQERGERNLAPWVIGGALAGSLQAAKRSKDPETVGFGAILGAITAAYGSTMLSKPKVKEAMDSATIDGFVDEMNKLAAGMGSKAWSAAKGVAGRYGELLAGGKRKRVSIPTRMMAFLNNEKVLGERPVKTLFGMGKRDTSPIRFLNFLDDPKDIREAKKVLGTRAATAAGTGALAYTGLKKHRKTERKQMSQAYITGARDMYGHMRRSRYKNEKTANLTPPVAPHVPPTSGPPPVAPANQATPRGMSPIEPKKPSAKGLLSGSVPKYTKVHSVPVPGRSEGYQPVSQPPAVKR